jgi:hypothetical protein
VNIIPPPTNAIFDPNSGTYNVPENFGKINKETGEYSAPIGLKLGTDGQFKVVDPDAYMKSQKPIDSSKGKDDTRAPASENSETTNLLPPPPPNLFDGRPEMVNFIVNNAPVVSTAVQSAQMGLIGPVFNNNLQNLADEQRMRTDIMRQTASEAIVNGTASKVKFIFNAE